MTDLFLGLPVEEAANRSAFWARLVVGIDVVVTAQRRPRDANMAEGRYSCPWCSGIGCQATGPHGGVLSWKGERDECGGVRLTQSRARQHPVLSPAADGSTTFGEGFAKLQDDAVLT